MTTLILIRHGETEWNLEGRYTGQSDVPLNARGLEQAQSLAKQLQSEPIAAIYSSDLQRARQTADALRAGSDVPLHLDARLREIHQGEWEGLHLDEIRSRYQQIWERQKKQPYDVAPPGGETVGQVLQRVLAAVQDILDQHPSQRIAVVSHGLPLALLRIQSADLPIETVWDHIPSNTQPFYLTMEQI